MCIETTGPDRARWSVLASCLIYARALIEYVIFILWVRSVSKMLLSVKFMEDKVLTFLIFHEKCSNSATLSLTQINPNFQNRLIRQIGVVLLNGTLFPKYLVQ